MKKNIAVLRGDGIGPEVVEQALKVLKKVAKKYKHEFTFEEGLIGGVGIEKKGNALPAETITLCEKADAILFGAIGDPKYDHDPKVVLHQVPSGTWLRPEQALIKLRKALGLYINLRPIAPYKNLYWKSPLKNEVIEGANFVVIRELTGGIYYGKRGRSRDGKSAFDTAEYSTFEIERVGKFAFELAKKRKKHVTMIHKANVLETSRLWQETLEKMAKKYPDVTYDTMYVDSASMHIIKKPTSFDVIVTENMFGDILTDEASVIVGSIGMMPSASIGDKTSLYEPIHGSFPRAAGQNTANPIGTILSAAMLLEHSFGMKKESQAIYNAVEKAINKGWGTKDIVEKNPLSTSDLGDKIAALI